MSAVRYLADTSALIRMTEPEIATVLTPFIEHGVVATCGVTDLQLMASVQHPRMSSSLAALRSASFAWLDTSDADLRRAGAVGLALSDQGHRLADWPLLLVAAVAERHGVAVLHHDSGFDLIAKVTGQDVHWVVPKGTAQPQIVVTAGSISTSSSRSG